MTDLLRLCEQSRVYCDIAQNKTEDEELQYLLSKAAEERSVIVMEVSRFLRGWGKSPSEYFSSVFRRQQIWVDEQCPVEYSGLLCSIYLSEMEMNKILSEIKGAGDFRLVDLMQQSIGHSRRLREKLVSLKNSHPGH